MFKIVVQYNRKGETSQRETLMSLLGFLAVTVNVLALHVGGVGDKHRG